ncbi:response regulator transcription factor [Chryseobacterium hagamense]|uniref:Oxygen regulatory protein NreC n=1 Tax=Chryseobacterium hagamense TaxID=395935 RepID=A0A511YRV1_9FLAO|nr:response regulator transcription factor [Chryseobacterium hagamense]GEN77915.1 oxygen regulatory protein NreC [Chryseobacterium hagamense]
MFNRILIADDHSMIRLGVSLAIEAAYGNVTIDLAEDYFETQKMLQEKKHDLLIMDIQMPGVAYSAVRHLKEISPAVKILLFSGFRGDMLRQFISEGADGYLNKQCSYSQIMDGINTLYSTGSVFPPEIMREYISQSERKDPKKLLSEREYEIFLLLVQGYGNLEITNRLAIQPGTVSTYKKRIFTKLKVNSIPDLVKLQIEMEG